MAGEKRVRRSPAAKPAHNQRADDPRSPERIVHARGSGAHGYFEVYESQRKLTRAKFLQDPKKRTPVFVRFSTVAGGAGSADTVRDLRGFAVKFYTEEGNYDLVGNNVPVFFIQDAMKFPDFVHAVKPEPHRAIPQAPEAARVRRRGNCAPAQCRRRRGRRETHGRRDHEPEGSIRQSGPCRVRGGDRRAPPLGPGGLKEFS